MKVAVVGVGGCWIVKNRMMLRIRREILNEIVLALIVIWR